MSGNKIINFEDRLPHDVAEVICINCKKRWVAVYPSDVLLKELQCPKCKQFGYVIMTGQQISEKDLESE